MERYSIPVTLPPQQQKILRQKKAAPMRTIRSRKALNLLIFQAGSTDTGDKSPEPLENMLLTVRRKIVT